MSKFQSYHTSHQSDPLGRQYLWDFEESTAHFLVVTLSPIQNILKKYEKQPLSSRDFYQKIIAEKRLHFVDGHQIFAILRAAYNKITQIPTNLFLNLETPAIYKDNVFIGIISSNELSEMYHSFGDALFFENVRDFLSPTSGRERTGRTTPNAEIMKTISTEPDKMLARNNGIVFGADKVEIGASERQLLLKNGSVVNGCQTTMCLTEYANEPSYVLIKVVVTSDAWDIAKSANYQNAVADIDLELARYLRPQLVKRAASTSGIQVDEGEKSAFQIIDEIYDRKIVYEETRLLYIGIFSRTPNNVFTSNYTELLLDLIDRLYRDDPYGETIFETLFTLQGVSQEGWQFAKATFTHEAYVEIFERFYGQENLAYRCFISILALCGTVNINITDRKTTDGLAEYERMKDFLMQAQNMLKNRKERFLRYYKYAVKLWMQEMQTDAEDIKIRQDMYRRSSRLSFKSMFRKLCMEADLDDWLREEDQKIQH